jgi:hypothetical protein
MFGPRGVGLARPFLLVTDEPVGSTVAMQWTVTSTRVDDRQTGVVALRVGDTVLRPQDLVDFRVPAPRSSKFTAN